MPAAAKENSVCLFDNVAGFVQNSNGATDLIGSVLEWSNCYALARV